MTRDLPDLSDLAIPGTRLVVKATPKAARSRIVVDGEALKVFVTAPPDKGKANEAIRKLLAKALGCAKSRLILEKGQTSREKHFRVT